MIQVALWDAARSRYIKSLTLSSCAPLHVIAFDWCENINDSMAFPENMGFEVITSVQKDYHTRLQAHCII